MTRKLIMDVTEEMGCGVNPDKSENVVPGKYVEFAGMKKKDGTEQTKECFKWLGYYLRMMEDNRLEFDEEKVKEKFKSMERLREQIYQYTSDINIRWRVYKTFLAPFVELYLPIAIQKGHWLTSIVHVFQHKSICRALKLPSQGISIEETEKLVGEKSVTEKANRLAKRLLDEAEVLELEGLEEGREVWRTRRREYSGEVQDKAERRHFMTRLAQAYRATFKVREKVKFDGVKISKAARLMRKRLRRKVLERKEKGAKGSKKKKRRKRKNSKKRKE